MGQYQQWLHYREIDQALQTQLETLEKELAHIQERTRILEQSIQSHGEDASAEIAQPPQQVSPHANNQIMHLLLLSMNGHLMSNGQTPVQHPTLPSSSVEIEEHGMVETISTALFAWTNLPNFGPQAVPDESQPSPAGSAQQFTNDHLALPPIPHSEMALLPEDMGTFIDQHTQTDPQLELPHWLRNIASAATTQHPDAPIDQESIRTNRLVQRWVERWGRQAEHQQKPGESQP